MMTMPGGRVVAVEVGGWEIEGCVAPPGIGDRVAWPLVFRRGAEATDGFDRPAPTTGTWRVERQPGGATFLVDGPLVAYWSERDGPVPAPGLVEATGVLSAALHGGATPGDLPTVAGIVRGLWVISQVFVPRPELGPRCVEPVAGTLALRKVDRSAQRFKSQPITTEQGRRSEVALLVELDLGLPHGSPSQGVRRYSNSLRGRSASNAQTNRLTRRRVSTRRIGVIRPSTLSVSAAHPAASTL